MAQAKATVAGISVVLDDQADETSFPTDRSQWPGDAHAPTVLGFTASSSSFNKLAAAQRRSTFGSMAHALAELGRGARAGNPAAVVTDDAGRPIRSIAYTDAVTMGERVSYRARMLAGDEGASSCGMFVRSLLKMIGATTPSFSSNYVDTTVFDELHATAGLGGGVARVKPGDEEPWFRPDGSAVNDENGKQMMRVKMPKVGDAVIIANAAGQHAHTFVVTDDGDPDTHGGLVKRKDRNGITHAFFSQYLTVAQGGQAAQQPKYPDDGSCMGTNERTTSLDSQNWVWDQYGGGGANRSLLYWIDIAKLGDLCDDKPIIMPDRKMTW